MRMIGTLAKTSYDIAYGLERRSSAYGLGASGHWSAS